MPGTAVQTARKAAQRRWAPRPEAGESRSWGWHPGAPRSPSDVCAHQPQQQLLGTHAMHCLVSVHGSLLVREGSWLPKATQQAAQATAGLQRPGPCDPKPSPPHSAPGPSSLWAVSGNSSHVPSLCCPSTKPNLAAASKFRSGHSDCGEGSWGSLASGGRLGVSGLCEGSQDESVGLAHGLSLRALGAQHG